MNWTIGDLGHLFVVISFIASLLATASYLWAELSKNEIEKKSWFKLGNISFIIHGLSVFGIVASLFTIIYTHDYRFHYAWSHSSNHLAAEYMISCFWEGQEGSFLLWIFWHVILGFILLAKPLKWQAPIMVVFCGVQAFLASMILGSVIGDFKLGSSPFILLREAMPELPIFGVNPDYIPEDGRGLNPLLQNYWMVIHPPTLFLGFALTLVPFAMTMAALWRKDYSGWIKPAFPWVLAGSGILGLGIMMGAYWAYETLNFGGYWNWDPVENAVYIPWLTLVATVHGMLSYNKNRTLLKISALLSVATFLLVLYATFLTRSGILGNASVHSFTDLGLSGQLLVYLLAFVILAIALFAARWKGFPGKSKEMPVLSGEFWIFMGILVLTLSSFQVLSFTSIPVYNKIGDLFGLNLNMAPPADQITTYSAWQLWFGLAIAIVSSIGQIFWWGRAEAQTWYKPFTWPLLIALAGTAALIPIFKIDNFTYIALLLGGIFSVLINTTTLWKTIRTNVKLSGGAIAHIGVAMMLVGILFSSGFSKVISLNNSGLVYRKEFTEDINRDNVLLWRSSKTQMGEYNLQYKGDCYAVKNFPTYVKKEFLAPTNDEYLMTCRGPLTYNDKQYFKKGDTVEIEPENTYYAVQYASKKDTFMLFPRAQVNPNMGLLASPDVKKFWKRDLYSHVSSIPKPDEEKEWSPTEEFTVAIGDTFIANDFIAQLVEVVQVPDIDNVKIEPGDAAVKAVIRIFGEDQNYISEPKFVVSGNQVGRISETVPELGLKFTLINIDPATQKFTLGVNTSQKDWIILKVLEKPMINLLWMGTIVVLVGFGLAWGRRQNEQNQKKTKPLGKTMVQAS